MAKPIPVIPLRIIRSEMRTAALFAGQAALNDYLCQVDHPFQVQILDQFMIESEAPLLESSPSKPFLQLGDLLSGEMEIRTLSENADSEVITSFI